MESTSVNRAWIQKMNERVYGYLESENYALAEQGAQKVLDAVQGHWGRDDPNIVWFRIHQSDALYGLNKLDAADGMQEELLKEITPTEIAHERDMVKEILYMRNKLATRLHGSGRSEQMRTAVEILRHARLISSDEFGRTDELTMTLLGNWKTVSDDLSKRLAGKVRREQERARNKALDSKPRGQGRTGTSPLRKVDIRVQADHADSNGQLNKDQAGQLDVPRPRPPAHLRDPSQDSGPELREKRPQPVKPAKVEVPSANYMDGQVLDGTDEDYQKADTWFTNFLGKTHDFLDRFQALGCGPRQRPRIAILDTGVNKHHPDVSALFTNDPDEPGIRECKSWLPKPPGDEDDLPGDEDQDGHGTYCAMTAHKVAPGADLYIARIFKDRFSVNAKHVADAIRHAVKVWQVDIISMSFAMSKRDAKGNVEIGTAIDLVKKDVLMFAAASNSGANSPRKFPAKHPAVFCIHSANGLGGAADLNPRPFTQESNFSTLGVHVELPRHGQNEGTERISGTSIATPAAAGIAALVLEYARHDESELGDEHVQKLVRKVAMQEMFVNMCRENTHERRDDRYFYLQPWELIAVTADDEDDDDDDDDLSAIKAAQERINRRMKTILKRIEPWE